MLSDQYTQTDRHSWFERACGSMFGALLGLLLFLGSFPLEVWNEGRAINLFRALEEGAKSVVSIAADKIDPGNEGKLVHVSAAASTKEVLHDQAFCVSRNALKMQRRVEMYQWDERTDSHERKTLGGGSETDTTYTYGKKWSATPIDSQRFHHFGYSNPPRFPYENKVMAAQNIHIGRFVLNRKGIDELSEYQELPLSSCPAKVDDEPARLAQGRIFVGRNLDRPAVGDLRVSYSFIPIGPLSVVATQKGDSFAPYVAHNGTSFELVRTGVVAADSMFKKAEADNDVITWVLRVAGFILAFLGLLLMGKPIAVVADLVPIFGDIVEGGLGLVAFCSALFLTGITIGIAWLAFRPMIGIGIICGGIVLSVLFGFIGGRRERGRP